MNVRRLFIYIDVSIYEGTLRAVFEANAAWMTQDDIDSGFLVGAAAPLLRSNRVVGG